MVYVMQMRWYRFCRWCEVFRRDVGDVDVESDVGELDIDDAGDVKDIGSFCVD